MPGYPNYAWFTNVSSLGSGGVWKIITHHLSPILWSVLLPAEVHDCLVSEKNRKGDTTNSDLELTGLLLGWIVLKFVIPDLKHCHIGMFCDNTHTAAQANRIASKRSMTAGHILRALSLL